MIGMVPKLMKQGGITPQEKARIDRIMRNFEKTREKLMLDQSWTKVDNDRYNSMQLAYRQFSKLPLLEASRNDMSAESSIANI